MTLQWLIDTIGKLGPAAVALAVYLMTRRQNRWQQMVASRSAEADDQKLRLALLDRRLEALKAVEEAVGVYMSTVDVTNEMTVQMRSALKNAGLVFNDEESDAIFTELKKLHRWQALNRAQETGVERNYIANARDRQNDLTLDLVDSLPALIDRLRRASSIRQIPPLALPPSTSRIKKTFQWIVHRRGSNDPS